jgi:hypothetical protein
MGNLGVTTEGAVGGKSHTIKKKTVEKEWSNSHGKK